MNIVFSKISPEERNASFDVFKKYLKPVIDDAFGWDEEFQSNGFKTHLKPDWFSWILVEDVKAGLVCSRSKQSSIHIHLLVVFLEYQRNGIASSVVNKLKSDAAAENTDLTLNCFKNNIAAVSLYKKLGFVVMSEEEHFYRFILRIKARRGMIGHWQIRGYGPYAVEEISSRKVLGTVGFWYPNDWPSPEIKWALSKEHWGKGFASEATRAVQKVGLEFLTEIHLISLKYAQTPEIERIFYWNYSALPVFNFR